MIRRLFFLASFFLAIGPLKNSAAGQAAFVKLTENRGQWDDRILFKAILDGGSLFIERNGLTFSFYDKKKYRALHHGGVLKNEFKDLEIKCHAYKIHFENSTIFPIVEKTKQGSDYENFFLGNDQTKWQSNVKNYRQVFLREIYKGIDYEMTTSRRGLKYNFHVRSNVDPSVIQMRYEGVKDINLVNDALILKLDVNEVLEQKPYAYQLIDGRSVEVKCAYQFKNNVLSFLFPNGYDKKHELVIDPVLVFAAQSGSTADNFGMTATYDAQGNLYSGGVVYANGYPTTTGAFSTSFTGTASATYATNDVVISKYNASGTNLLFSTYMGGNETEVISSMIVDGNDNLCFYGSTSSINFPMLGSSYDNSFNGGSAINFNTNGTSFANGTDLYIGKLNSSGTTLLGCTYLGGSGNDGLNHVNHLSPGPVTMEYNPDSLQFNYCDQFRGEIQIDLSNNIYIASNTRSSNFPAINAYDNTLGGKQDAIVAKFNPGLTQALFCTYLGGTQNDCGNALIVSPQMEVYVTGGTCSSNFPATSGASSSNYNGGKSDGFIAHFNAAGNILLNATYVGTNNYDQSYFIQSNKNGDIYIFGQSLGNMPVVNFGTQVPYQNAGRHQFVTRYAADLSMKKMSTVFGSSTSTIDISPSAFGIDKCSNIYISGWGGNPISGQPMGPMPLVAATQSVTDGHDFYLMVLDSGATSLQYGSYFGGNLSGEHVDGGTSRIDKLGTFYQSVCAGCWGNDDFPVTTGAWPNTPGNPNHSTLCNNGVFKIASQLNMVVSQITSTTNSGCAPLTVNFTNSSLNHATSVWYVNQVMTSTVNTNPAITFTAPGNYTVSLVVKNPLSCNKTDSSTFFITVGLNVTSQITSTTSSGCAPLTVNFTNSSLNHATSVWYVNQVMTSTVSANPVITFTAPGNHTVSLVVKNPLSCNKTDSSSFFITVTSSTSSPLVVSTSNTLCVGESSTLTASAAGSYSWSTGNTSSVIVISPTVTTSYTLGGTDLAGCAMTTTSFTQFVDNCTSVGELQIKNSGLIIYPNPMKDELTISSTSPIKTVRLFNVYEEPLLEGKVVDPHLVRLDVKTIPGGLYIVEVQFENSSVSAKRVVKRE